MSENSSFLLVSLLINGDTCLYLLPSIGLALIFHVLSKRHPGFFLLILAGTVAHEVMHFLVAAFTNARPISFSVLPRRSGNAWILGTVGCANIRWYNAVLVGFAPLLVLAVPVAVAAWRTRHGLHWNLDDIWIAGLLAPQFLSCLPSSADLRMACRSWPLIVAAAMLIASFVIPAWR
jgi:hypothetical protein